MSEKAIGLLGDACRSLCTCGAEQSDEGHTIWCKWSEEIGRLYAHVQRRNDGKALAPPASAERVSASAPPSDEAIKAVKSRFRALGLSTQESVRGANEAVAALQSAGLLPPANTRGEREKVIEECARAIETVEWFADPLGTLGTSNNQQLLNRLAKAIRALAEDGPPTPKD